MDKGAIKKFAINARNRLIDSVKDRAGSLGITEKECTSPIQTGEGFEVYKTQAGTENKIYGEEIIQRRNLVRQIQEKGYENIIEEVAYTWFNRIIAIRFMEVNDYIPTRVRVLSSENEGKIEPDIINEAPDVDLDFTSKDVEYIISCKSENKLDELFRFLFKKQCESLGEILPELFEKTKDYTEMLLNISYINEDDVIRMLVDDIEEDDFRNAVEIIGWLYQYYNEERKNTVININKSVVKKEDIPAATQLFTTDWIVRYMVDNSLGKYWIERNPNSLIKNKLEFYIEPKEGEVYKDEVVNISELTFFDDCMGSGHILVYAFEVFIEIYKECGYTEKEAAINIVENNIYGLDIDKRAYQLAYFAIMMKARSYNRKIFSKELNTNLAVIEESNNIEFKENDIHIDKKYKDTIQYLIDKYTDAKEIGSLQTIEKREYEELENYIIEMELDVNIDLIKVNWLNQVGTKIKKLIKQADIMSNQYYIVATNPPYLNKYTGKMKKFVNNNYKEYSGDLFSVFIYRNLEFCKKDGYTAFMTPFVWMFIKTYINLRKFIIESKSISSLIQLEYSAFEEATVPICAFVLQNGKDYNYGCYIKLSDFRGGMDVQKKKVLEALSDSNCRYFYETSIKSFLNIPALPITYWANDKVLNSFNKLKPLDEYAEIVSGMTTGNNDKYMRNWKEVDFTTVAIDKGSLDEVDLGSTYWFPYNKGGAFRRWYGNNDYVVNWSKSHEFNRAKTTMTYLYLKPCITWSDITSAVFSARACGKGFFFDVKGSCAFPDERTYYPLIAFLNSKIAMMYIKMLNPTITTQVGDLKRIPFNTAAYNDELVSLAQKCIQLGKEDYDSYELSWNFLRHPLTVCFTKKIETAFKEWKALCEERFYKMKETEIQINQFFINLYDMNKYMSPENEDKYVSIYLADAKTDIKSLISYAVGCMFGRYSLDVDGLAYAGGYWNASKYRSYPADADNIIPICEDEYFQNDIMGRFVKFIETVYGADTVEENLKFISAALGGKGSPRDIILNYFINDFYNDHCKRYQKRPIYWLFDSGKENGFKALIYMHRYDKDTVGRVRIEYLHKTQFAIENGIMRAEHIINSSTNAREKAQATKDKSKYIKQLAETRIYDQAIAHIANKRIEIDLDDGVKVNYEKFQGVEVSQEGKKTVKIDLLAKI